MLSCCPDVSTFTLVTHRCLATKNSARETEVDGPVLIYLYKLISETKLRTVCYSFIVVVTWDKLSDSQPAVFHSLNRFTVVGFPSVFPCPCNIIVRKSEHAYLQCNHFHSRDMLQANERSNQVHLRFYIK
jgi:hypothetical protein